MSPRVSIIMPVFDGEEFLAEAIQSVLDQSFQDYELIVVDDGSRDGSAEIIRSTVTRSTRLRCIEQSNAGVSVARNRGISAAGGELIAFLDQDDRWTEDALDIHVAYHAQHPEVGYTLGQQICFLEGMAEPPGWFRLQRLDVPHTGYLPGTLVVKRAVFARIGLFDTRYPVSSDADWFARAGDSGIPLSILPNTILHRRIHAGNQSRHSERIHGELTQLLRASIKRKRAKE